MAQDEYVLIKEGRVPHDGDRVATAARVPADVGIVLARFLTDPVWWLYITWLPVYLYNVRGFNLKEIGLFGWLPFVTADAGSLLGGYVSGRLIARGWSVESGAEIRDCRCGRLHAGGDPGGAHDRSRSSRLRASPV